jgi:hypothetical protein
MVHVPYSIVNRTGLLSCNTPPQLYGLGLVACSISELLLKLWIISTIGKTPWKGNQPHARPLRPQDNTTQKAKTNFHAVRGIRAHDFSMQAIKPDPQTAWNVTLYTQLGHKHFYKLFVKYYLLLLLPLRRRRLPSPPPPPLPTTTSLLLVQHNIPVFNPGVLNIFRPAATLALSYLPVCCTVVLEDNLLKLYGTLLNILRNYIYPWRYSSGEPLLAEQPPLAVFPDCTRRYWVDMWSAHRIP